MICIRNTLAMIALVVLTACGTAQLYHQQLVSLDKGMNSAQTASALQQPPLSVHETKVDGIHYTFHRYFLSNGRFGDVYLLCFEEGKLKYWGYIDEFRRYPDLRINKAMDAVLLEIRAAKK
ncbi:MAG TPA: hypothetical protein VK974_11070 [Methylophilaceae bacterium]|nr:hypothetical protein [Methylophilaceae bacterium]